MVGSRREVFALVKLQSELTASCWQTFLFKNLIHNLLLRNASGILLNYPEQLLSHLSENIRTIVPK